MAAIKRLDITAVRNIETLSLDPVKGFNLFHGVNGSGKTSVLEAVHALATGRSFRSSRLDALVNQDSNNSVIFAEFGTGEKAGFSKSLRQTPEIKLNSNRLKNWEQIARLLPVLVLDSNAFQLVEGGPKARRAFMDWGVFHVEPKFVKSWRDVKKCIAQRNLLLKKRPIDRSLIGAWDNELCLCAEKVDIYRKAYIESYEPIFNSVYSDLAPETFDSLSLQYFRGWDKNKALAELLVENGEIDSRYGATQSGPHRAELVIKVGQEKAIDVFSRGQLKMLVMAMRIAQGKLLSLASNHICTYLVDDLAAELDTTNRSAVLEMLIDLNGQVFVTAVERHDIESCLPNEMPRATFHVERGTIRT